MAVAHGNSIDPPYNSYKVPGLVDPILETPHISYLEDRFILGEQLGWGQFGVIRECSDMLTGQTLACKSIAKDRLLSSDDLLSVKLEIDVMARLSGHPNIVALKAVYEEEDCVHLVMELCAGGELFHHIEKHGRYSEHEAAILFQHLMGVVMYCHDNGIVHRDLKPENILLATKSSTSPIKLADFGLAAYIKPGQSLYGTVGSPFYIAPEVLAGGYNEAADVWSAGVILYILLSGMPPFWGKTRSKLFESVRSAELRFPYDPWGGVSRSAKDLIAGMLCIDPAQRLTAKQVLDHAWIKGHSQEPNVSCGDCDETSSGLAYMRTCSFCTPLVHATRDISSSTASPIPCQAQADHSGPAFSCRSSFSPFMMDATPCSPPVGFSFHSSFESTNLEFSTPILSMPSFSFFSPLNEQENLLGFMGDRSSVNTIQTDFSFRKLMSPDPTACFSHDVRESEPKGAEVRKSIATWSRTNGIHSRRNHTIGLGEHEQLDLMVSESVIRWASCTQLSSTPSLGSSLVC